MRWLVAPIDPEVESYQSDFEIVPTRGDNIKSVFKSQQCAIDRATDLAKKTPGKQYGVFGIISVYETTDPKVLTKKLDSRGQLVLDKDNV